VRALLIYQDDQVLAGTRAGLLVAGCTIGPVAESQKAWSRPGWDVNFGALMDRLPQGDTVSRSVLIADDDEDIRTTLADLIAAEGWRVDEARDGAQALEKALRTPPDVLILDQRMPGLTGAEVYRGLRARGIATAVVLVTADRAARELADSIGVRFYLKKPFDVDELLQTMEAAYRARDD
jgi:two-component system response regulator (stage 0 sporulation protein F)